MSQSILQLQREIINLTLKLQNELLNCNDPFPASTQSAFNANHQFLIGMINSLPSPPVQAPLQTTVHPPVQAPVQAPVYPPVQAVQQPTTPSSSSESDETDWEAAEEAALAELEAAIALQS